MIEVDLKASFDEKEGDVSIELDGKKCNVKLLRIVYERGKEPYIRIGFDADSSLKISRGDSNLKTK